MKPVPYNSTHLYPLGTVNGTPDSVKRDNLVLPRIFRRIANAIDRRKINSARADRKHELDLTGGER